MESKCLEYVRNQIVKLKDDLQHYTMVEKDSALESQIRYDLEQFETIEKELQDLDTIKEIFSQYGLEYKLTSAREALLLLKQYQGSFGVRGQALITKKLEALEIIKNKGVFVHLLQQSQNMEEYNSLTLVAFKKMAERDYKGAVEKFCLTQEEYDLLKEVLK